MEFKDESKLVEWLEQQSNAASSQRMELLRRSVTDRCYYEGIQWINRGGTMIQQANGMGRLMTSWNPDSSKLRVTVNRVTKFVIKAAAATMPERFDAEVMPMDGAYTLGEVERAQTCERLLAQMIDQSGYLGVRRDCNFSRCVTGTSGIGLSLTTIKREIDLGMGPTETTEKIVKAFEFDPARLILDPGCGARSLHDHEYVIYQDVWTRERIRREWGLELKKEECQEIGTLAGYEIAMSSFSSSRVYARYATNSKTLGARIYEMYCKGVDGRYKCYRLVEKSGKKTWINQQDVTSPWGGDGLPYELIHAHRRPDSLWSIGDVSMLRDDQDKLNLLATLAYRIIQKNAGYQIVFDKRSIPKGVDDDEFAQKFSNQVAGAIAIDMGRREDARIAPQVMQYPMASPVNLEMMRLAENDMREQVFRSEGHFGVGKSHVPYNTSRMLMENADQVLGTRIMEDIETDRRVLEVLLGTTVKHAQEGSPVLLADLADRGFVEQDFLALVRTNPERIMLRVGVRESSVRYRSESQKREDLNQAIAVQALGPMELRMAMAGDIDSPVTQSDGRMLDDLRRMVVECAAGIEWVAMPLGEYAQWAISMLRQEMVAAFRRKDIEAAARLERGIQQQEAMMPQMAPQGNQQPAQPEPQTIGELSEMMAMA